MKIFVSFFLLFSSVSFACTFKKEVKKVISLSGSMTVLLNETGLLKGVSGISVFNPVSTFKGTVYPGGLFIAQSTLSNFSGALVFFDQGEQIRKILSSGKNIISKEVITRNLLPLETVELTKKLLSPYVSGCEEKFSAYSEKAKKVQNELLGSFPKQQKVIFYLGEIKQRLPELVMANDGVVKLLLKEKKIISYPSELSYVNWSAKVLSELPKDYLHVGISDPGMKDHKEIKKSSKGTTLIYPGSLVPGLSQLEAFLFWARSQQ
jgi:hypothetical protein